MSEVTDNKKTKSCDHWEQVEQLFHSTCSLDHVSREAFLAKATHDVVVVAEVRLLLESFDCKDSFMEEPAAMLGLSIINKTPELMIGETISRYRLLRLLGRGGMSEV